MPREQTYYRVYLDVTTAKKDIPGRSQERGVLLHTYDCGLFTASSKHEAIRLAQTAGTEGIIHPGKLRWYTVPPYRGD